MICTKCNTEFDNKLLYCPNCGQAVQIVPDYNVLDEDILPSIITGDEEDTARRDGEGSDTKTGDKSSKITTSDNEFKNKKKKRKLLYSRWIYVIPVLIAIVIILIAYRVHEDNQFDSMVARSEEYIAAESYEPARNLLNNALKLEQTDYAYYLLAICQYESDETKDAITALKNAIMLNSEYEDAYKMILEIYAEQSDYDAIMTLKNSVNSDEILALFDPYITDNVEFSLEEGTYEEDQELELISQNGFDIYYTTDGSSPTLGRGRLYKEPIKIKGGVTIVSAAAISEAGDFGPVEQMRYVVEYPAPAAPIVSPPSGTYPIGTMIQVSCEEGYDVFYTTDGTTPTYASRHYLEPIPIQEGETRYTIIVYDSIHKIYSTPVTIDVIGVPE